MKKEKDNHKLPPDYFEDFQERLEAQIELERLTGGQRESGFKVPEKYFDTLLQKLTQIPSQHEIESKLVHLKPNYWPAISIAAAALLLLGIIMSYNRTPQHTIEIEDIALYVAIENTDFYTEDITALLTDEDINAIILNDETHPEEEIINYLEIYSNPYDLLLE